MNTPSTQMRLTNADKAAIERVRAHHGLPSLSAAVRFLAAAEVKRIDTAAAEAGGKPGRRNVR